MFDNPKKELEWLQEQLLAAENDEEEEVLAELDDIYDDFAEEEPFDDELDALLNGGFHRSFDAADRGISDRAAGFDADDYEMDTDRYVPARKNRNTGLIVFALVQSIVVIALVIWALGRLV